MQKRKSFKRIGALLLCILMFFGNVSGAYAAEEVPKAVVSIHATLTNVTAIFDKEEYVEGDFVNVTLTPEEGYVLSEGDILLVSEDGSLNYETQQENGLMKVSFQLADKDVELTAEAKKEHTITFSYKDVHGGDASALFEAAVMPQTLTAGTEVTVSVNYKGAIGWAAKVGGASGTVAYEMTSTSLQFVMPDEDVAIEIEEIEVYNKGDLSTEDTELGEDIGKEHQVTTSKEYEPDVSLGKSAKWDDIEKGTATLTLTQKSTSDWSDNPSDYMIVLDRTISMVVDHTVVYDRYTDTLGFGCSVCLNPNHFYMYQGKPAKLIDYGHGFYISSGQYFSTESYMGSDDALWDHHYDSTGKRIAPRVYNGCIDRLTIAQNSIKDILDVLDKQNQTNLAGGKKNRVMYWSFSGSNSANDGTWDEVPKFTEDMAAVKKAIKYEGYPGTYYYRSFEQMLQKLEEKQKDKEYKDIPTKAIFISDGMLYDKNPDAISAMAKEIRETPNTKLYTILIGNSKDSEAGKLLKSYATSPAHFATVTSNWDVFVDTITAIQKDQFEIKATEKVVTDKINTEYWEVVGEPILESGNGTASLDDEKKTLTWTLPEGTEKTYTCKIKLKLKDEYRYLLSDTSYPTNEDEEGATDEEIVKNPTKAGATIQYKISGGKYNGETRTVGIKSPELKYGTVQVEGTKHWTVAGSNSESVRVRLKRTMPGAGTAVEINNTVTNVTKDWKYVFSVRQLPDGTTYPLIKYNNAGEKIDYQVIETMPEYYQKVDEERKESDGKIINDFYNEPFKVKVQIEKIDEETKNSLSGAEFSVYTWSEKAEKYVPYKGTDTSMDGAEAIVKLKENNKGVYLAPVWLYYSQDNLGKFRIIETKTPEGYFGDWKDSAVTDSEEDKNVYDLVISSDSAKNGETVTISNTENEKFANQRVKGEIIFSKLDLEGKVSEPQGEASLVGAVYKLYAAEDIVHQDGTTGILYKKDQEIKVRATANLKGINVYCCDPEGNSEIKTASAAMVRIENLELGKYYLKEVKASKGYLIDPEKYEIDVAYVDEKTEVVTVETDVYERVMKQSLSFYKYTSDNNEDILEPMKGAKFSVYLVSELENGRYGELSDEELVQAVIDELRNPTTLQYDTYQKYSPASVYADQDSEDVTSGRLTKEVVYEDNKTYRAVGRNTYLVSELESDENGVVKVPGLPYGRYIVIETTTPAGKTATRPFVINVTGDEKDESTNGDGKGTPLQDKQLTVLIDRPIMSLVRIMKRDALSKETVLKEGAAYVIHDVEGAWFDYISNEMTTAQKREYQKKYGNLVAQYSQGTYYGTKEHPFTTKFVQTLDESESVFIETPMQLPSGTYELEEIAAPDGYILQGHEGVIAKKTAESGNGTYYETEENGKWKETPQGRVKFIVSNNESVYDENIRSFVTTVKQDNEPAVGKISIYTEGEKLVDAKKGNDSENYEFEYQLRPIEGAEFEVRAGEDIYSQEGGVNAVRLFEKGELVVTLVTDENGQTWTGQEDWENTDVAKGLPLGKYTVTQVTAGEGFYLSEENKEPLEVEISYAGQEVPVIYKSPAYRNPRQTVKIEVKKTDAENGKELQGAAFGLFCKNDMKNYKGKTIVAADTMIAKAWTSTDGEKVLNAVFSPDLPFGDYYVKELKAPEGYTINTETVEISMIYEGQNVAVAEKTCEVKNDKTKNAFVKTDLVSGAKLSGAQFEIWEILTDKNGKFLKDDTGMYVLAEKASAAWESSAEEAYVVEGLTVGKTYILRELKAPWGYVGYAASDEETKKVNQGANALDEEIMFVVQDTSEVVMHEVKNQRVVGNLNITKEGEFLTEVKISVIDQLKNLVNSAFGYLLGRVENVTFAVYVKEDIYAPDGSGEIATWTNTEGKELKLEANTLIEQVTTDHNGIAIVENLPLGKYFVKEVSTGSQGNFLLNQEIKELELSYVDQNTPIVNAANVQTMENTGIYYVNDRQKVKIAVDKYELDSDGEKIPVEGALFGLFAAEDIFGYDVDEEKTVRENITALIKADTLMQTVESDKNGKVEFSDDLPCGKYYVKEMKAPEGYLENSEIFEIDASYTGETGEEVLEFYHEMVNKKTEVKIRKTDLYTGKNIKDIKLAVVEKSTGETVAEWTTDGNARLLRGLKLSGTEEAVYVLKETKPAEGYVTAENIEFKLVQNKDEAGAYLDTWKIFVREGENWKALSENVIEMKDDITKVEIQKVNSETKKLLSGAKLELRDSAGKVVKSWTSSEKEGYYVERLPIGTYRVVETKKMDGYAEAKPLVIKIVDTNKKQVFVFENKPEPKTPEADVKDIPKNPPKQIVQQIAAVSTGDYAPIGACVMAAAASLAGFGIARKRRK